MNTGGWGKTAKELFENLLDWPEEERARVLAEVTPEIRDEVSELFAHLERGADFLREPMLACAMPSAPATIGPYALIEEIGVGGTSRVFLARRADELHTQRLALKVIWRIVADRESERTFRREVEALARLEHPGIVRFIDGGVTEDGKLYFAMEYVEGESLTKFAASQSRRERLVLFQEICESVAFAHRHLIVHRDLKPTNILVRKDGTPKLLDFGIALLLNGEERETMTGFDRMTLMYASPEQIRREKHITTASDVYSLGVILYELLTGVRPFERALPHETMKAILDEDPPEITGPGVDLAAIVFQALKKKPEERYGSVDELREDIGRYLQGLPVKAHRDSWRYRAGKFVSRHRIPVAAGSVLAILLLAGGGILWTQYRRANQRLEAALVLANTQLVTLSAEQRQADEFLIAAEQGIASLTRLVEESGSRAAKVSLIRMLHVVGTRQGYPTLARVSNVRRARAVLEAAVSQAEELCRDAPGGEHAVLLSMSRVALAAVLVEMGQYWEADAVVRRAIQLRDDIRPESKDAFVRSVALSHAYHQLARVYFHQGELLKSKETAMQAVAMSREFVRTMPAEAYDRAELANGLLLAGVAMVRSGDLTGGRAACQEALSLLTERVRSNHSFDMRAKLARAHLELGRTEMLSREPAAAAGHFQAAVDEFRRLETALPRNVGRRNLAMALSWLAIATDDERVRRAMGREAVQLIRAEASTDAFNMSMAKEAVEIEERVSRRFPR